MAIKIIQGSDKNLTIRITSVQSGDPYDFTDVNYIRACFLKTNGTSLYKTFLKLTGDTVSASDIISNIDTTDITEGMPIFGPGIPVDATVLKTPTSTTSPTAAGTIKISANALATATGVTLTLGDIEVVNAEIGKIQIHLHEADTDSMKVGNGLNFEVKIVNDGFTSYVQFPKSIDVIKRYC